MKNWIQAIRPKTLLASVGPVLLGLSIAYAERGELHVPLALTTFFCALFLQVASNLANDYLDAASGVDGEKRLGPVRVTSSGLLSPSAVKRALVATLVLSFLLGLYLMWSGGVFIVIIGLSSLYFAYGYTGGPFPLSHLGLGEVAAFLFFGVIAVWGTTYLQTHEHSPLALAAGMGPGFISACILAVNNLRDIASDTQARKRTLAVRFGEKFQRVLCLLLIASSLLLALFLIVSYRLMWATPLFALPFLFRHTWRQILAGPIDGQLNLALQRTAQYNLLYSLLLSLGILMRFSW